MKKPYQDLINEIYKKCQKFYNSYLVSFVIFGSVAREKTNPYSDIEILIISDNLPTGRRKRILDFLENIELPLKNKIKQYQKEGYYIEISPVIKTPKEVQLGSFLYLDIIEEGKILYDKDNFFKNYLKLLKNKLKKYGAKKIYKKGGYYWVLKEKLQLKDEIKL